MRTLAQFNHTGHGSLHFPPGLGTDFKKGQRVILHLQTAEPLHCMLYQDGSGFMVGLNKTICKQLSLQPGQTIEVDLKPDTTRFQAPEPEEWVELMHQDPEAEDRFLELTAGQQRAILFYIHKIKTSQTRILRSLHIATRLKAGLRKPQDLIK